MIRIAAVTSLVLALSTPRVLAQTSAAAPLDAAERAEVIETVGTMLEERYVFPEVAAECAKRLAEAHGRGDFADVSDPEAFAGLLTEVLQGVSHDKHMRVRVREAPRARMERDNPARARARQRAGSRAANYGFERVERLEGNVGYVDMRYFAGDPEARATATAERMRSGG